MTDRHDVLLMAVVSLALSTLALGCSSDETEASSDTVPIQDSTDAAALAETDAGGNIGGEDIREGDIGEGDIGEDDTGPPPNPYPAPGDWGPNTGPGGPTRTFTDEELYVNCATLDGGPDDTSDHHNLLTMYDGYLLMPWSPEFSTGGLTFFDIEDPCDPKVVGSAYTTIMRETHSIGFSHIGGAWAVTNGMLTLFEGGILFWDIADPTDPVPLDVLDLEGFTYPDAYAFVTFSVFWQAPFVYVAGADNGIYVVDATDPRNPEVVNQLVFDPILRAGQVQAVGNLLVVTAAEGPRTVLLDISDPADPQPIPGGDFLSKDRFGDAREAYFTNVGGGYVYYARKDSGGGLMVYDIHDPSNPTFAGDITSDGNGGYVFVKDHLAFVGESNFAAIYDLSDLDNITEVARLDLEGDLDTASPIGNVVLLSVDDDAITDEGTAVAPYAKAPDSTPPTVTWVYPPDGATDLPLTSRFGLTFNEFIDVKSAWEGSVRLYETGTDPALTRVEGHVSAQEVIVNFWPVEPLKPGTSYTLEIPAGGIADFNGNTIETPFTASFTTFGVAE